VNKIVRKPAMTPEAFIQDHLQASVPVIVTDAMRDWPALERWSPAYLKQKCGDMEVQVYDDLFALQNIEALSDYLDSNFGKPAGTRCNRYVRAYVRFKDVDFSWADSLFDALADDWDRPAFFPRDAFILPRTPPGGERSPVTDLFPYKGLFISGGGARTRLHRDPFGTDAVLCQFYGEKRLVFYAPDAAASVMDADGYVDPQDIDTARFPAFGAIAPTFEDVLRPGEILFIPGSWFHDVTSLSDSISVTWNFVHESHAESYRREVADMRNDFDRDMLDYLGGRG